MNKILIIGAGRSATALINYLLEQSVLHQWSIVLADTDLQLAQKKAGHHPNAVAVELDIHNIENRQKFIQEADLVVSMLPAFLHIEVARDCLAFKKHLITASYVSNEMRELGEEARKNNLIFMSEIGLDPGIDHMSAMQMIDGIKAKGGKLNAFYSYTGGLVAPESDDNPWHYKFTWNPRNVIVAGQTTAQYLEKGKIKFMPYDRLFQEYLLTEVPGLGTYEIYPNRDSLSYRSIYDLEDIPTIYRGTMRTRGFCDAWNALVKIGLTDEGFNIEHSDKMTYRELLEAFARPGEASLEDRIAELAGVSKDSKVMDQLRWAGLFENERITRKNASPATILEHLLLDKWALQPEDKDMIIMKHEFEYALDGQEKHLSSTLVMKGEDQVNTAMAKLVGLPMAIFVKLVMTGKFNQPGVLIPVMKEAYDPVLSELREFGVVFEEVEG
ncbi:MAG: saccharopine dehydrogenase NADP-binding domain-containing protein [Saprospiraceae bacterium]|nr:saccharopine dehydrogenase NADP-binding domain-containing protein [Saprospiraceae bacterium]MCB9323090.1 saccharopine dehydrogenase NADP-binding domain-containing protein [Lewinellaceae bacterium]